MSMKDMFLKYTQLLGLFFLLLSCMMVSFAQDANLFVIARTGDTASVQRMLETGYDVNGRDQYGQTPLMYAASSNTDIAVIDLLISAGADVNATTPKGWTALMFAAKNNNNSSIVERLIQYGADGTLVNNEGMSANDYLVQTSTPVVATSQVSAGQSVASRAVPVVSTSTVGASSLPVASFGYSPPASSSYAASLISQPVPQYASVALRPVPFPNRYSVPLTATASTPTPVVSSPAVSPTAMAIAPSANASRLEVATLQSPPSQQRYQQHYYHSATGTEAALAPQQGYGGGFYTPNHNDVGPYGSSVSMRTAVGPFGDTVLGYPSIYYGAGYGNVPANVDAVTRLRTYDPNAPIYTGISSQNYAAAQKESNLLYGAERGGDVYYYQPYGVTYTKDYGRLMAYNNSTPVVSQIAQDDVAPCIDINSAAAPALLQIAHINTPSQIQDLTVERGYQMFSSVEELASRVEGLTPAQIEDIRRQGLACVGTNY